MKKALAILCMLLAAGCTKDIPRYVDVSFTVPSVQSAPMTRASYDDILGAISSSSPDGARFTLSLKGGSRTYNAVTDETYSIITGTYSVSGSSNIGWNKSIYRGKVYDWYNYTISDEVQIVEDIHTYPLSATHTTFALVYETSQVAEVLLPDAYGGTSFGPSERLGGNASIKAIFLSGEWTSSYPLTVKIVPVDTDNYQTKILTIAYGTGADICAVAGYFYKLTPGDIPVSNSFFEIDVPLWLDGDE